MEITQKGKNIIILTTESEGRYLSEGRRRTNTGGNDTREANDAQTNNRKTNKTVKKKINKKKRRETILVLTMESAGKYALKSRQRTETGTTTQGQRTITKKTNTNKSEKKKKNKWGNIEILTMSRGKMWQENRHKRMRTRKKAKRKTGKLN